MFVCIDRNVYDPVNPVICGVRNRILRDTGSEAFKTHETGTVHRKFGPTRYLTVRNACVNKSTPPRKASAHTAQELAPVCALHLSAP
jgi:hypothetical protein